MSYSLLDKAIINFDSALQTIFSTPPHASRPSPAQNIAETPLNSAEKTYAARLMRINHVGEICAQALYQGQALTARSMAIKEKLHHAAQEEVDHLAWCQQRITELNGHTSYLNPLWYAGSLALGISAGLAGDNISLGFLAETEHQVEQHLGEHLKQLPIADEKSRKILAQMQVDEKQHAVTAEQAGAAELPTFIKTGMRFLAKIMKITAYWI